jgi:hypothetical protein
VSQIATRSAASARSGRPDHRRAMARSRWSGNRCIRGQKSRQLGFFSTLNIGIVMGMSASLVAATPGAHDVPLDPILLGDEIARTAAHLDAATHRLLTCIRAFDASGEWARQGAISCAHWLAWRIGLDPGAARERVRVARALGRLPLLDDGLRRGALSYAKVRALTRVASPENEATLTEMAGTCTGAQLEKLCRRFRRVVDVGPDGDRLDDRRYVRQESLDNGMVRLSAVLHPDEAALVMKAIQQARREPPAPAIAQEAPAGAAAAGASDVSGEAAAAGASDASGESRAAMIPMADALVNVARTYLAGTAAHPEARPDTTDPRSQLFVHLDQDPVAADGTLAATLDDGTRISAETWRRLGCDTTIVPVHHGQDGETIGRRRRTVAPALRLALWMRDRGCRFPGCSNQLFVHAHHIQHWAHGGPTTAENLALLCTTHHRMVHEGGFTVRRLASGDLHFADPRGRMIDAAPPPADLEGEGLLVLERCNGDTGVQIDADTGMSRWDGDSLDYEWALDALIRESAMPTDSRPLPSRIMIDQRSLPMQTLVSGDRQYIAEVTREPDGGAGATTRS